MKKIECIEKLYFEEKKTLTQIAEELKVSVSYVTKILKQNQMYSIEKEKRKEENLVKRREKQKESIYKKRKQNRYVDLSYIAVKNSHEQATRELSKSHTIGNQALRKWCSNAYQYNSKKKRYEFNAGNGVRPIDLPKYIKI